jgi:hypothetical protein
MTQVQSASTPTPDNWMPRWLLGGTILGAALGLLTAYLMVRNAQESRGGPPEISVTEGIGATIAMIGVVRTIASLGD